MNVPPYPWLAEAWHRLASSLAEERLGHAYLVSGPSGLGKHALAEHFSRSALCEGARPPQGAACGRCRSCLLLASGHHPDRVVVGLLEDKKAIGIDQVRELGGFYALKSHYGRRKVAIVDPAETMTSNAANALLKLLEEPPPGALMLLIAHRPGRLPATILSRCQRIAVAVPPWSVSQAWLAEERARDPALRDPATTTLSGTPLAMRAQLTGTEDGLLDAVLEVLEDWMNGRVGLLEASRRLAAHDVLAALEALELLLRAVAILRAGHPPRHLQATPAATARLQRLANQLNSGRLFAFLDGLVDARTTLARSSGVRGVEALEVLLHAQARYQSTSEHA